MSRLAGFWRVTDASAGLLEKMKATVGCEDVTEQVRVDPQFGVVCMQPAVCLSAERIARSEDRKITLATSGHLFGEDKRVHSHPAEHCLRLYQAHGDDMGLHLNGTFTIAINDERDGSLRLITDRFNSRGFYYCQLNGGVLFANSVRSLLAHPGVSRSVSTEAICEFLTIAQVLGEDTYYPSVRHLPPASVVTFDRRAGEERRYWRPRFEADDEEPLEDCARRIATAIRDAVRNATTDNSRDALMLSGGMDSRAIAAASDKPLTCVTMHSVEAIELALARRVAYTLRHEHVFVRLHDDYPLSLVTEGVLVGDGMHGFDQAQPLALSSIIGERGINRVFNGWGMDMYLAGLWMPRARWRHAPAEEGTFDLDEFCFRELEASPDRQLSTLLGDETAHDALQRVRARLVQRLEECKLYSDNIQDAIALSIVTNFSRFPHYLNLKALSAVTAEAAPMHDVGLIQTLLSMPYRHRFYARAYRRALQIIDPRMTQTTYSGTGVAIYQNDYMQLVASYLQRKVARRMGKLWHALRGSPERMIKSAWPDMGEAMRRHSSWHKTLDTVAANSYLADHGIVEGQGIVDLIEEHKSGRSDNSRLLANWLTLETWFRHYG